MKKFTTRNILLIAATLAFGASAFARPGDSERQLQMQNLALKNFRYSLDSDVQGIVESIMADVVVYKAYYPALDYSAIVSRLNDLAETSAVPSVSYKAHLASIYLKYAGQFQIVPARGTENPDDVFRQIARQLEKSFLSSNLVGTTTSSR